MDDRLIGGPPRAHSRTTLEDLRRINEDINVRIFPAKDDADEWRSDATHGDCEDYALAKRAALIAAGWRADQLLIAIAETPGGVAHAVLIARMTSGDYVLDSRSEDIIRWDRADLRWLARQSAILPARWVRVEAQVPTPDRRQISQPSRP